MTGSISKGSAGTDIGMGQNNSPTLGSSGNTIPSNIEGDLEASVHRRKLWPFRLRPDDDDGEQDWWFASTAIPLLAATTGPAANLLSIAALVTSWRCVYTESGKDADAIGRPDPRWCIASNIASLVCGFVGNLFLLLNFTRRVRYIIALPMTIIFWYAATILLITILVIMNNEDGPHRPQETYTQGFWHAVIAACVYLFSSMMLMINMMGYFLGHYPQHFTLTDHQRTLILQTMMFFIWLGGGAAVFSRVCGWQYVDALYFCDVTILTVGFGDYSAPNDTGRGLVFPFSVGGIIMLGLMVGSIARFARELSADKVLKRHVQKQRTLTVGRAVTTSHEYGLRQEELARRPTIAILSSAKNSRAIGFEDPPAQSGAGPGVRNKGLTKRVVHTISKSKVVQRTVSRTPKVILLRQEKDRFDAMRTIQQKSNTFKRWYNLTTSVLAFGLLWCVGAAVFVVAESKSQGLSYFQALYFCYVSLLTIGYGDLSPKSNIGKPFFIVWSLVAVPTMTILISDMGDTVIASFKRGTFTLADFTVLPQKGIWRNFMENHPWLLLKLEKRAEDHAAARRIAEGLPGPLNEELSAPALTIEELAAGAPDEHSLARKLALAIRKTANDLHADPPKRYTYEEWVEFTRLIRFSSQSASEVEQTEEEEGIIEWDWIGEDSPMLADSSESEWVLDRLCESLDRHMRRQVRKMGDETLQPVGPEPPQGPEWDRSWAEKGTDT
ncbi:MAG: Potassium channel [Vezdaea aestivalis]|nr:MAG: Potassium channel [Vezdaea aestivalis]